MIARSLQLAFGVISAILLIIFIVDVFGSPVSFDGAMNLQVAASLADGHGYARFYDEWILFPEEVQTNAPFILPASLVFALFGVSLATAQVVSIAYVVALILVVFWLVRQVAGTTAALGATSLVLLSPEFSRFAANGYGEAPALLWFLVGLGFFCRAFRAEKIRYYVIAGMCLGLAVLTKTVMLMPVGILLALSVMTLLSARRWHALGASTFAFVLPIAAFETWRAMSLGGVAQWSDWWNDQLRSIFAQAGVRDEFQNTPIWTEKILRHASILAENLSIPVWVLPILALVPAGLVLIALGRKKAKASPDRMLLLVTLALSITAYFLWWLLVTPTEKAWHRRIFNGLLLLAIAAPIVFGQTWPALRERPVYAFVVTLPLLVLGYSGLANFKFPSTDNRSPAFQKVVEFMRAEPQNARFYGFGWYSAPVFSLYSGRHVHDLRAWKHLIEPHTRPHYLLVDTHMVHAGARERALRNLEHRTVVDNPAWARVVEITGGFEFSAMPAFETGQVADEIDFFQSEYSPAQGFHQPEGEGWRWVEPAARIALRRTAAVQHLVVRGYLPSLEKYRITDPRDEFSLEAVAGQCRLGKRRIEQSGQFELRWSLKSCPGSADATVIVTLQANAVIKEADRQLSWIVHSVGFSE